MVTDFRPLEILRVLLDEEVDFLLVGGIAVATYVTDRATGDIDIMVPTGDHSNKERLERALQRLDAQLLGTQAGHGRVPAPDDPYPTLLFSTRHGKLDVLSRPDGSARYEEVRARAREITVLERTVRVAASDDLVRMKLAAGRRQDLDDVATLTTRGGARTPRRARRVRAVWRLPATADPEAAVELLTGRVVEADRNGRAWLSDGDLTMEVQRADLSDEHLRAWVAALHDRLRGVGLVEDEPSLEIS